MHPDKQKTEQYAQKRIIPYTIPVITILGVLQLFLICTLIRYFALQQVRDDLHSFTQRISQSLVYSNGRWDTTRYTADPQTPHPSGSSGFLTPLYIISADGFIIERNAPIPGFLDSSDFSHLMDFQKAQNVSIITNEQWRVISKPVVVNGKTIGVIVGALYHPERFIPSVADTKINNTINYLQSGLDISNSSMNVNSIDLRGIDYDVSFEIVNNFNKVLLNNGRMPTFIDKSYIYQELESGTNTRTIQDPSKKISYIVVKQTLYDAEHNPVGIVLAGKSINYINTTFYKALPYIIGFLLFSSLLAYYTLRSLIVRGIQDVISFYDQTKQEKSFPKSISFNKRDGKLQIDEHSIEIPIDSNQYYLCKAIFSNIKKRWELDELLEEFGDDSAVENWRKIYDTMTVINKKASPYLPVKLIELREKTYSLNPDLQPITMTS